MAYTTEAQIQASYKDDVAAAEKAVAATLADGIGEAKRVRNSRLRALADRPEAAARDAIRSALGAGAAEDPAEDDQAAGKNKK